MVFFGILQHNALKCNISLFLKTFLNYIKMDKVFQCPKTKIMKINLHKKTHIIILI